MAQIQSWIDGSSYDARGDLDLDGDVDSTDKSIAQSNFQGTTSGFNDLTAIGNRKGYAGYEWDGVVSMYHVRHRVLHPVLGRWARRDPLRYADGMNVYEYVGGMTLVERDSSGASRWWDVYITSSAGCSTSWPGKSPLHAHGRCVCNCCIDLGGTYACNAFICDCGLPWKYAYKAPAYYLCIAACIPGFPWA
ncbi:MAG: hypothetical protein D8M59_12770 [Planctomycetes bacterium]|nr:hypothetical protein [Planctomycetota bacterium]NOG53690.1 hypothetical protein [Planctomycetota bacterium]